MPTEDAVQTCGCEVRGGQKYRCSYHEGFDDGHEAGRAAGWKEARGLAGEICIGNWRITTGSGTTIPGCECFNRGEVTYCHIACRTAIRSLPDAPPEPTPEPQSKSQVRRFEAQGTERRDQGCGPGELDEWKKRMDEEREKESQEEVEQAKKRRQDYLRRGRTGMKP